MVRFNVPFEVYSFVVIFANTSPNSQCFIDQTFEKENTCRNINQLIFHIIKSYNLNFSNPCKKFQTFEKENTG